MSNKEYYREYRKNNREKIKENQHRYYMKNRSKVNAKNKRWRENNPNYNKRYHDTIIGYLRNTYSNIEKRCNNSKNPKHAVYVRKDIQNKFGSVEVFINYVVNTLRIDPRGLKVHRIDNNGHYEPGNIEFLTQKEHNLKHRILNETIHQS